MWLPATRPRGEGFVPGADVRGMRGLPGLIVAGGDLAAAAGALTRSPPRSSSMSAPEESRSSGTVSNAAGQLLRSGAGIETPGAVAAVVVR